MEGFRAEPSASPDAVMVMAEASLLVWAVASGYRASIVIGRGRVPCLLTLGQYHFGKWWGLIAKGQPGKSGSKAGSWTSPQKREPVVC